MNLAIMHGAAACAFAIWCGGCSAARPSKGLAVQIADNADGCGGDGRIIIAHVREHGLIDMNRETWAVDDLDRRLQQLYEFTAERVLYVTADRAVDFQNVADVIDIAKRHVEVVALITPSTLKRPCLLVHKPAPIEWVSTGRQPSY